jgi:hypothetical protein
MRINRKALRFVLVVGVGYLAWQHLSLGAQETAVLHINDGGQRDLFTTLWIVDDQSFTWLRAEKRTRRWLDPLRENPNVRLHRDGQTINYVARFYDDPDTRSLVNGKFRRKYGLADGARGLVGNRDSIPIRLERY